ncbi:DUF4369 domain-containing protein [Hymenobacter cheonanensis]|uniref:DUF4369 domain-containing protein n=1 Tax=Hymenobacter sp. CA2-7 TaxID=3063993 RepID=UPI0027125B25|nr:DUF4369 domain-containing protein [Hymenobacter sp. CA2-7]MDO7885910.1 DUF4369 domain-containing protein [Hymenobacter sp. CA2-7]
MKLLALLFLPLALLPLAGRAQPGAGYEITGQITGLADGARLYLIDGSQRRRIDSATVQQGHFALRGTVAEPVHTYLYAGRGRASSKLADILLDNQRVQINGSQPAYNDVVVSGSDIDRQWKEWFREDARLAQRRLDLGQRYQARLAQPDTAGSGALRHERAQVQHARIVLLKAYVRRYHDTAVGAALPTMCTLGTSLTGADYQEMYQSLTPRWQQSTLGREILTQAGKHPAR